MLNSLVGRSFPEIFLTLTIAISALAIAISVHEAAHAWMANRLGDPTARHLGRISLNPLNHIDPFGTVILPLLLIILNVGFLFGWAKPTPFNPWNLKNPRRDAALISLAGPASNFVLAIIFGIVLRFLSFDTFVGGVVLQLMILNLILFLFNLVPIPPLDGFKVVGGFLPKSFAPRWESLEQYGFILLIAFFFFGGYFLQTLLSTFLSFFLKVIVGAA